MLFSTVLTALLAVILSTAGNAAADSSVLLQFNPPKLVMSAVKTTFKVRMMKSPSADFPATVILKHNGFKFSQCRLTFTSLNYKVYQEVELVALPSATPSKKKTAKIACEICMPNTPFSNLVQKYVVAPKQFPLKKCTSTGGIV
jgi:hypothetical protein